jgi:hypothetical protein
MTRSTPRPNVLRTVLLVLSILGSGRLPLAAAPHDARGVTLLLQGAGPAVSSKASEETWGEYLPDAGGRLHWTGFVGYLVRQHGWNIGGVVRPRAEQVLAEHLDPMGAAPAGRADVYILASSLPAQTDGLDSRARELASAVAMLRSLTGTPRIRLVAYSASGVAARIWMQGGLENQPYPPGSVDRLICVATPHLGVGTLARPAAWFWRRYGPLAPDSDALNRINRHLALPPDVRFIDVVIQSSAAPLVDSGRSYRPYVRLPETQVRGLPPLLGTGHDGVVHVMSAQLHLTPTAARYENETDQPIQVVVCTPPAGPVDDVGDLTLHTLALRDPSVWQTLRELLEQPSADPDSLCAEAAATVRRAWAEQIARHLAATTVQHRHPTGRIVAVEIVRCEITARDRHGLHCAWQAQCEIEVRRMFRQPDWQSCAATGSFTLDFDRFQRPIALRESATEVSD